MAREGERGAEEERVGLQGPCREGGDESGGLERVFVGGGGVVGLGLVVEGGEVGGDEAERVVLGAKVEEVVELGLALFHHTTTRRALCYRTTGVCCRRAPALPGQAVRAPHFSVFERLVLIVSAAGLRLRESPESAALSSSGWSVSLGVNSHTTIPYMLFLFFFFFIKKKER